MRPMLIAIGLAGLFYVMVMRRRFDLLAVAFVSACVYFVPGFLGFAAYPTQLLLVPVPLTPDAYVVMTALLASNLAFLVVVDWRRRLRPQPPDAAVDPVEQWPWEAWIATALAVTGAVLTFLTAGPDLFGADKIKVMEALGRGHILWATGATVGFVAAYVARLHLAMVVNLILLALNLLVGFRVEIVIAMFSVTYLLLSGTGESKLVERWRLITGVLLFGASMIVVKYFLVVIKLADAQLLLSLVTNAEAWRLMFANSEPFITQGILNEVMVSDFRIDPGQLADAIYLLVPFAENLGAEVRSFNAAFQPTLFSSVIDYGLANNFWAQQWSAGGFMLLLLVIPLYHGALVWIDQLQHRARPAARPVIAIAGVYLAFYIHRNDLVYQLTLERRIVVFGALVLIAAGVCRRLARAG